MSKLTRRDFLNKSASAAGVAAAAPAIARSSQPPSDQVRVAVVGFNSRGGAHINEYLKIPNVKIAALCDIDERLFKGAVHHIEEEAGYRPRTEPDFRRLLEDPEIDAVSIATPDHWHALQTIWACQAGKDVYVEKPISYTLSEGRKMVEAARKYDRVVQVGTQRRSHRKSQAAMDHLRKGNFGRVYRAKAIIFKGRASIGHVGDSEIPDGVHWDLFLGPAPYRAFNENRFHYGWHFFWDTSTTDIGNSGVHELDLVRWGMNKQEHPVQVHCSGGIYQWDSDQETPNVQVATFEYADGSLLEVELSNLYTPPTAGINGTGQIFYTTKGYVTSSGGYQTYKGKFTPRDNDYTPEGISRRAANASFPSRDYEPGIALGDLAKDDHGEGGSHFSNFIDCLRSRRWQDLNADIQEGHLSTALCHLANVSYRTGRKLDFNPHSERFLGDEEANSYLTRIYRPPFVVPEKV